ncbi:MAG: dihydrodipicolinate synthase family protein [Actinomycetota bacterium]
MKKKGYFKGIIPPLVTSFDKNGNIYEKGQREIIEFLIPYIDGVYPCGTYGSGPLMKVEERKKVAEIIIDQINGRIPTIIHVGSANTRDTVQLAKHAQEAGADAVGAIAPYYFKYSEKEIINHFKQLSDSVDIPVYVYNNPGLSGNVITPSILNQLSKKGVAGVKDSSFDLLNFYLYQDSIEDPDFDFIVGTEAIALGSFLSGGSAAICGLANAIPEPLDHLWELVQQKKWEEAQEAQMKVVKLRKIMKIGSTLTNCYAILKMRRVDAGYPRLPHMPVTDELYNTIKSKLDEFGVI